MSMRNLLIYGDSLSTGTHGENAYLDTIRRELGLENIMNFAVGSSGLTEHTPNSMMSILRKQIAEFFPLENTPDIILVWHGSNDWYWGSPLGSYDDEQSFRGAIRFAVETLRKQYPDALIVWPTSIFRLEKPDGMTDVADGFINPNKNGDTLADIVLTLREAAVRFHFPLIDMGSLVDIHLHNEEKYMEDHVHPNASGYEKIARALCSEIKKYWGIAHGSC